MQQQKQVTIIFDTEHTPGNDEHLDAIATNYFRRKGVRYENGIIRM